jgi:hypothetical protein
VQQQTGVPLKHTQHMQPAFMQAIMQSQQAWTISQAALSPLVQVMQTPISIISQVQLHIAMLHWHMTMPFFMQQQLHMPSHSILHMFCSVAADISSSQTHIIFMPPAHFSIFMVQRGVMVMLPVAGIMLGIEPMDIGAGIEPIDMLGRSVIIGINIAVLLVAANGQKGRVPRCVWCPSGASDQNTHSLVVRKLPVVGRAAIVAEYEYSNARL